MTPLGKALNFLGSFIMWLVIILCLMIAAPRLAGIKSYVVISGSMEPAIPVGSMVYAKTADPSTLAPGEIIVFYRNDEAGGQSGTVPVTHRVVENNTAAGQLTTKGDANAQADFSPVTYNNVLGRVVFHVRGLGYIAAPLSTTMGKVGAAMIILAGYLLTEIGSRLKRGGKDEPAGAASKE